MMGIMRALRSSGPALPNIARLIGACRKAVGGTRWVEACCVLHALVNLLKSEHTREQIVLIMDGPLAGKDKTHWRI